MCFSSRRRHTRYWRDWSSDVCSSDLPFLVGGTLLMALSVAAMGLAPGFWAIPALAVLSGVGNSVIHPADYAILAGSIDRKSVVQGKSVDLGGRRIIKKKPKHRETLRP